MTSGPSHNFCCLLPLLVYCSHFFAYICVSSFLFKPGYFIENIIVTLATNSSFPPVLVLLLFAHLFFSVLAVFTSKIYFPCFVRPPLYSSESSPLRLQSFSENNGYNLAFFLGGGHLFLSFKPADCVGNTPSS